MATASDTWETERIRHAQRLLDIPELVPPETLREILRERLEQFNLLPAGEYHEAILVLAAVANKQSLDGVPEVEFTTDLQYRTRRKLQELTASFFDLPVAERRRRWRALRRDCERFPVLRVRHERLRRALDIERPLVDDKATCCRAMARQLCDLFVLSPAERRQARCRFLRKLEEDGDRPWRRAVHQVRAGTPKLPGSTHHFSMALSWREDASSSVPPARSTAVAELGACRGHWRCCIQRYCLACTAYRS